MCGFKKTVYPIKYFCVKISLTAFRANFSLNIFNYIQPPMKPTLPFNFLFAVCPPQNSQIIISSYFMTGASFKRILGEFGGMSQGNYALMFSSISFTAFPVTGCFLSGAISERGFRTKSLSCKRGWGISKSSVFKIRSS